MEKAKEKITYSLRNKDGKELVSCPSLPSTYFAIHVLDRGKPLYIHKISTDWHNDPKDCGTVGSTDRKTAYYVYCDSVKKRNFYGEPIEMASNGFDEAEYTSLDDAMDDAKALAKESTLDDDYIVYVERIIRELDEDGDIASEEYESVESFDFVRHVYGLIREEDREKLDRIQRNIEGDSEASELARTGITYLHETDIRFDEVINRGYLDCFNLESEIRDSDAGEDVIEEAMRIFIKTAEKVGVFELVHAGEY